MPALRSLYDYTSYRKFLNEHFGNEKSSTKSMTLAFYAGKLGISTSGLNMILKGKRKLTTENIHLFAKYLKLSEKEHDYFEALVLCEQATDKLSKSYYSARLKRRSESARLSNLHVNDRYLLSGWYVPALLIYLIDFKKIREGELERVDYDELARRFRLPVPALRELVKKFQESGFFSVDNQGRLHIVFDQVSAKIPQINFIKAVSKETESRIETHFDDRTSIFRSFVFSVDPNAIPRLKKDLISLFEKYMQEWDGKSHQPIIAQALVSLFAV